MYALTVFSPSGGVFGTYGFPSREGAEHYAGLLATERWVITPLLSIDQLPDAFYRTDEASL